VLSTFIVLITAALYFDNDKLQNIFWYIYSAL